VRAGSEEMPRLGVAIGDQILDLHLAAEQCPWTDAIYPAARAIGRR
jgi:fumarylacetoacetase